VGDSGVGGRVHPKVVQERLGHANIGITLDTYSHVTASLHARAAEQVAAVIFGGGETVGWQTVSKGPQPTAEGQRFRAPQRSGYEEMKFVAVSALSHDGLVREHNEDSLVAGPFTLCAITTLTPQTLWFPVDDPVVVAVADGLGGHPAGEEASALAVRWLAHAAANLTTEAAVRDALLACNEAVYADADRDPERLTMGTTIAGVVVTDQSVIVFNVGDSRVYRFDESGLVQLSVDDNEAPARGQIRSPILTQTLGGSWEVAPIRPHLVTQPLGDTARYLICSDGLTDAISDPAITAVLRDHDGGRAAFELWKATIAAGAPDNVTIALLNIAIREPSDSP